MNEINMNSTVIPKSDQLNYDDIPDRKTKIIKVTKIIGTDGDQPVSIHYEGDNGKPYKPCKSMRRLIIAVWGDNSNKYIGQSMQLFGDETIIFGGIKVGGIRISHMTGIKDTREIPLTFAKGKRKAYKVEPLIISQPKQVDNTDVLKSEGKIEAGKGMDALKAWWNGIGGVSQNTLGAAFLDELKAIANKPKTEEPPENEYPDMPPEE